MNRRDFIKYIAGGVLATALPTSNCSMAGPGGGLEKPNIILIMADDLGYGDIGCYGNKEISTPNIDTLAQGGMKLTDYHSNGAVCSPTRAAMLTGRYQQRAGIEGVIYAKGPTRQTGLALEETTFAEVLKTCSYVTGIFGKWHLGYNVEFNPVRQGFDEFRGYVSGNVDYHSHIDGAGFDDWWKNLEKVPEEGYCTDLITKHGIDFIERHKDESFCLYLPHESVHSPYQGRNDHPQRLPDGKKGNTAKGNEITRAYKEMVEIMDEGIGKIVDTVKRLGMERKTFIFFCSDNGATKNGSNGALAGYKGSLWEGGHRVPAIAHWPDKIKPGTLTNQPVLGMDIFPTIVSIAGAKLPIGVKLDGVNLSGMLTQDKELPERTLFWRYRKQKAVRKGALKLLVQGKKVNLYNLDDDLGEKKNLAGAEPEMVKMLQAELDAWEKEVTAGVELKA